MIRYLSVLIPLFITRQCKEIKFKPPYPFSSEIVAMVDTTTGSLNTKNYAAMMEYINIGEYEMSKELSNVFYRKIQKVKDSSYASIPFSNYEERDAITQIVRSARDKRVVILNENHFSAYNRVFARRLIIELSKLGFNSLGIEMYQDTSINTRGFPLLDKSYSSEPQFANFLREASRLDFDIFNYEVDGEDFLSFINKNGPAKAKEYRDSKAARNLTHYLQQNPERRLIVYCGHQHVYEYDPNGKYLPMAKFLKEQSGLDPLTIDQAEFHPYFSSINNLTRNRKKAVVLFSSQTGYYRTIKGENRVDITVFSPSNISIHNRQIWMFDELYKPRKIKIPKHVKNEQLLVFAYHKNEPLEKSVPVDCQETNGIDEEVWLSLPDGEYQIVYYSKAHSCISYKSYN